MNRLPFVVPSSLVRPASLPVTPLTLPPTSLLALRGGGDEDDGGTSLVSSAFNLVFSTVNATARACMAVFEGESDPSASLPGRFFNTLQRMYTAAFSPESKEDGVAPVAQLDSEDADAEEENYEPVVRTGVSPDYGRFLAKSYDVDATRMELDSPVPVVGGNLDDALKLARSQARLLVALIPSSKSSKQSSVDEQAVEAFLSSEVSKMAGKKPFKSSGRRGSFVLWSAQAGSPEAVAAMKRLKVQTKNSKGEKRPILVVAYMAQVTDKRGFPKLVPRLLAQHHCSPPPPAETMAAWLNALRKRHAKQYSVMEEELKELDLYKERKQGYKDSMQSDKDREIREKKEEAERIAKEAAEKARQEEIEQRREELRESLPDEPEKDDDDAITIALRFSDGRSEQRRFLGDSELSDVFNWVDATFEMERETVVLTTMNGKTSVSWEDHEQTCSDAGFSRMTGLRVSEKMPE